MPTRAKAASSVSLEDSFRQLRFNRGNSFGQRQFSLPDVLTVRSNFTTEYLFALDLRYLLSCKTQLHDFSIASSIEMSHSTQNKRHVRLHEQGSADSIHWIYPIPGLTRISGALPASTAAGSISQTISVAFQKISFNQPVHTGTGGSRTCG